MATINAKEGYLLTQATLEDEAARIFVPSVSGDGVSEDDWVEVLKADAERYIEESYTYLQSAKNKKLIEIAAYDKSSNVNAFSLNGVSMWFDRDTRNALCRSLEVLKSAEQTTMDVWYGGVFFTLPIDNAMRMLNYVELYAMQCLSVTEQHKAQVNAATTIEEVEAIDIASGYPSKLSF